VPKFGKLPVVEDERNLMFAKYTLTDLPPPFPSVSSLYRIEGALPINASDINSLFPMDGNDVLGDCTICGLAHAIAVYDGLVGKKNVIAASYVIALYQQLTGGPDTGLACMTVLDYWKKNTVAGKELLAYVQIDPTNIAHVKQAIDMFGAVYIGFNVQENCLSDFNAGITWTPGTPTNDGHCVLVTSYSKDNVRVLTWGSTQLGTWDWFTQMCDECYAILPPEAETSGFAPNFDFASLKADLAALGA